MAIIDKETSIRLGLVLGLLTLAFGVGKVWGMMSADRDAVNDLMERAEMTEDVVRELGWRMGVYDQMNAKMLSLIELMEHRVRQNETMIQELKLMQEFNDASGL